MNSPILSAPPGLYLFLWMQFIGLVAWGFIWGYFLSRGRRRILGFVFAFLPTIVTLSAFLAEISFTPQPIYREPYYILSTIMYQFTFYILPSMIGYVVGLLAARLRR